MAVGIAVNPLADRLLNEAPDTGEIIRYRIKPWLAKALLSKISGVEIVRIAGFTQAEANVKPGVACFTDQWEEPVLMATKKDMALIKKQLRPLDTMVKTPIKYAKQAFTNLSGTKVLAPAWSRTLTTAAETAYQYVKPGRYVIYTDYLYVDRTEAAMARQMEKEAKFVAQDGRTDRITQALARAATVYRTKGPFVIPDLFSDTPSNHEIKLAKDALKREGYWDARSFDNYGGTITVYFKLDGPGASGAIPDL